MTHSANSEQIEERLTVATRNTADQKRWPEGRFGSTRRSQVVGRYGRAASSVGVTWPPGTTTSGADRTCFRQSQLERRTSNTQPIPSLHSARFLNEARVRDYWYRLSVSCSSTERRDRVLAPLPRETGLRSLKSKGNAVLKAL